MRSLLVLTALVVIGGSAHAELSQEITPETVVREMNAARAERHLPPLRLDSRLNLAAEDRMRDMEEIGYWSHDSPTGLPPFVWLRPRGYDYTFAGENLATGFETVKLLVDSWMESPGHRRNILENGFSEAGVAVIEGRTTGRGSGYSIVVLFGRERFTPIR